MNASALDECPENRSDLVRDVANNAALLRELRLSKRESQNHFWARFGVTQTRGSRFELGQRLPPSVLILLRLYLNGVIGDGDLWAARRKRRSAGSRQQTLSRQRKTSRDRSTRDGAI
jgi:transcriptional regulator with XRE-family HTH domain